MRRSRPQRWVLIVSALLGTFVATAAAAQPAEHHPGPPATIPSTVPTTGPPTTLPVTTVPPTTVPPTTTEAPTTTTTEPPPIPTTTEPPIQEPTTTTTEPPPIPTTTEPPIQEPTTTTTEAPAPPTSDAPTPNPPTGPDGGGDGVVLDDTDVDDAAPVFVDDAPPTDGAGAPDDASGIAGAPPADSGDDEVALPSAEWLFSDGRTLLAPPEPGEANTRPLWMAVLLGLAAGIGLTATASVVVNNLNRAHPED
jgi:hypothetical protein